jgi:metal-responsive CopG/Arc/MetJ family transcriptional regulator
MKPVTVTLPDATLRALDDRAERCLRSRSNLVRAVLERFLRDPDPAQLFEPHRDVNPAQSHPFQEA